VFCVRVYSTVGRTESWREASNGPFLRETRARAESAGSCVVVFTIHFWVRHFAFAHESHGARWYGASSVVARDGEKGGGRGTRESVVATQSQGSPIR